MSESELPLVPIRCQCCLHEFYVHTNVNWNHDGPMDEYVCRLCRLAADVSEDHEVVGFGD